MLEIDSPLAELNLENKTSATAHVKGGSGLHPMICAASAAPR